MRLLDWIFKRWEDGDVRGTYCDRRRARRRVRTGQVEVLRKTSGKDLWLPACPIEAASFRPCDFIEIHGSPIELACTLEYKSAEPREAAWIRYWEARAEYNANHRRRLETWTNGSPWCEMPIHLQPRPKYAPPPMPTDLEREIPWQWRSDSMS